MTRLTLAAAAVAISVLTAGSAMAGQCPKLVKDIDAAMAGTQLSQAQMDETKALRDEGEKLHKAGKHADSVATLNKARKILGIM